MKKRVVQIAFIILFIAIAYLRISNDRNKPIKETRVALGTFVTIDIQDRNVNNKEIIDSSFALIHKYEDKLSISIENSEISKINSSGKNEIRISNDVKNLIDESYKISELSNGAFDITIGTILEKYDFVNKIMPDSNEIKNMLNLVDYKYLQTKGNKLIKRKKNIHTDLGGIAKGYIVDKVIGYLTSQGIQYAAVNAGGDLFVLGNKKNDVWKIGIRHPRSEDEIFGEVSLKNMSIVTSGDYEQFFFMNGKRIHHILNPKTGLPADNAISTTVIASDATTADALCTAIFVMGPQTGIFLINSLENVEALIIYEKDEKLQYKLSDGFKKYNFHCNE